MSPPAVRTLQDVRAEGKKSRAGWVFPKPLKAEQHIVDIYGPITRFGNLPASSIGRMTFAELPLP